MSEANLEIARALYAGTFDLVEVFSNSEMVEAVRPLMHPDIEAVFGAGTIPMGAARVEPNSETGQPTVDIWRIGPTAGWPIANR